MKKLLFLLILSTLGATSGAYGFSSTNVPLSSLVYRQIEKLAGLGLISNDIVGLKPYSVLEVQRLLGEAEGNLPSLPAEGSVLAEEIIGELRQAIRHRTAPVAERESYKDSSFRLLESARLRYGYFDGAPRTFERNVLVKGGASAFGFIGGNLRPNSKDGIQHKGGQEGTPLLENNDGIVFRPGHNAELRFTSAADWGSSVSALVEPYALTRGGDVAVGLNRGYVKLGGGGLELEVGRDENWFGPGYRGALTLTNNSKNFDLIKLSSPEPLDVDWVKRHLGGVKYSVILSRFDETGSGADLRQPYFMGIKLALKPTSWFEIGGNFVRQEGGPGFSGDTSVQDFIFGGGTTNKSNTLAGLDLRFRVPWLSNTEFYAEFAGEDSALFWPIMESYVAGIFIPKLTPSGRDDFRFEYFWGHPYLYSDGKFFNGYVYRGLTPGYSQGGAAQEFFVRYTHWFAAKETLALEYFNTERGVVGKVAGQAMESKHALRGFLGVPLNNVFDITLMYGWETINNLDLVPGAHRNNQLVTVDMTYRY